jgi:hypothetical protein
MNLVKEHVATASPILRALELLRTGQVQEARTVLGLRASDPSDQDFVQGLTAVETSLRLLAGARPTEALPHLERSLALVQRANDQEAKLLIPILIEFARGLTKLHAGDAHGALHSFEEVSTATETLSFFAPDLGRFAANSRVLACIALARASLNAGDVQAAERWWGKTEDILRELSALLNPENAADAPAIAEAYGTSVEFASSFALYDLQALATADAAERLLLVVAKRDLLEQAIRHVPDGPFRDICETTLIVNKALERIVSVTDKVLYGAGSPDITALETLRHQVKELSRARELASRAGDRGAGYRWMIGHVGRFARNLMTVHGFRKEDFGRYAGLVAGGVFVVLMGIVHLTIRPSQTLGAWYFLGCLILALIGGFGFGALRFAPLLRIYREVLRDTPEKSNPT